MGFFITLPMDSVPAGLRMMGLGDPAADAENS